MSDQVVHVGFTIFKAIGGKRMELVYKNPNSVPDIINLKYSWRIVGNAAAITSFLASRDCIRSSCGRINFTYRTIPLIKVNKVTAHLLKVLVPGINELAQGLKIGMKAIKLANTFSGKIELRIDENQSHLYNFSTVSFAAKANEITGHAAARAFCGYIKKRHNLGSLSKNVFRTGMAYQVGEDGSILGYGEEAGEYDIIGDVDV